jgi:hypothetical protein
VAAGQAEPERPAIDAPQITVNIFGVASPEQAALILQALPGTPSPAMRKNDQASHSASVTAVS